MIFSGMFHDQNQQFTSADSKGKNAMPSPIPTPRNSATSLNKGFGDAQAMHSHIWLVKVPSVLSGFKVSDFYNYLASEHQAIMLGIYRRAPQPTATALNGGRTGRTKKGGFFQWKAKWKESLADVEMGDSAYRYVVINPDPNTILRSNDRVYVLAINRPSL
jgi:hypothetical protein